MISVSIWYGDCIVGQEIQINLWWRMVDTEKKAHEILDLRGWSCPWCLLKAKSWLRRMSPGQVLEILSTDPQVRKDLPQVLEKSRDRVISVEKRKEYFRLLIRRG